MSLQVLFGDQIGWNYRDSKFVVVPFYLARDFPYVILQAFAAAKPVIGWNGEIKLVLENERGVVYECKQSWRVSQKDKTFLSRMMNFCNRLGKNARRFVEENFNDSVSEQLMINYKRLLKWIYLVIGGNGFIGSHLIDHLLIKGHNVRVFDICYERYRKPLANVNYRISTLDNIPDLYGLCTGIEVVYPFWPVHLFQVLRMLIQYQT